MDGSIAPALAAEATAWLGKFEAALAGKAALGALFAPECHWRDIIAFGWDITTTSGAEAIAARLAGSKAHGFRLDPSRSAPRQVTRAGTTSIEALFTFQAAHGPAHGVLRLVRGADGAHRAWVLLTTLAGLDGVEDQGVYRHAREEDYADRDWGGENWLDQRNRARAYADHDPAVLVVGGGQAGLAMAARLRALGVDTLIIDREPRIGDVWRKRYHALVLHNEMQVNHLPLMPFPPTWPVFIPKDMLASWFEHYVEALELNFWPGTELVSGTWEGSHWRCALRREDGSERVMQPRHVVFATGVSSIPIMPDVPGLKDFAGTVMHSGAYTEGKAWKGKRALVLGTGNSGHDVAQDLHFAGAQVSLVQRSETYVVSLREAQAVYSLYNEGLPMEDCDLLATSFPFPVLKRSYQLSTAKSAEIDKPLHEGLAKRGFRLTLGEDNTGFQWMYMNRGGGYYFNVGCSELIIQGKVGLVQHAEIDRFVPEGARLKDGTLVPADLVVAATGFHNQQETVRQTMGDAIADKVGRVWGFDAGGELRNMWRPTAQPGLWFTAGSLAQCRIFSKTLALQIKAHEMGLVT